MWSPRHARSCKPISVLSRNGPLAARIASDIPGYQANESARLRKFAEQDLLVQRLADTICDHSRGIVDGKRDCALEAVGSRDEQTESALERVGSNPCFVGHGGVPAAGDDGTFDAFSAMRRYTLHLENCDRHTASS